MTLTVRTGGKPYDIIMEAGALARAGEIWDLHRRVLIVTDSGVPAQYADRLREQCGEGIVVRVPAGEDSKSIRVWEMLETEMQRRSFTRTDCVAALGGGVVGDLAGFAAACYMRGIDFYNIPTTVLSQVDSSVGGKTALNLGGIKNAVGAFWQPRGVLMDPTLLSSLPARQTANGLAEAVKIAVTSDGALFERFENEDARTILPEVILRAVQLKRTVVEADEREADGRRILNFGHTIGHAIESVGQGELVHGECVALGMLPMCSEKVRARLIPVLRRLGLPTAYTPERERIMAAMLHDKKAGGDGTFTVVTAEEIGHGTLVPMTARELEMRLSVFGIG